MAEQWPAIDERSIREGLRTARPPGRVEITSTQPLTIFDGAHTPAKARWLARAVRDSFPEHRFVTVFRYRERPDIWKTLAAIAATSDEIVLTHCDLPGDMGVDPGYDAAAASRAQRVFGATQIRDPRLAFAYAVDRATTGSADGVLVTGSIPLVRQLYGTDVVPAAADPRAEGLDVAS
jgi:folylpolyglutamate synthase/dihydropteroate synthase